MECIRRHEESPSQSDYKSFVKNRSASINNDIEGSISTALTLEVMNICKVKIIGPFNIMLTMVGWRNLSNQIQCSEKYSRLIRFLDKFVLLLFVALLLFSYVYQVLACRFEMNINDQLVTMGPSLTTPTPLPRNVTISWATMKTALPFKNESVNPESYILCNHPSTTYIIPNIIHFMAYVIGMIHYRYNENEDIYGLMEKTLLYSTTLGSRRNNHSVVTKMLTLWMWMAVLWVVLAIVNHILYDVIYQTYWSPKYIFQINSSDSSFSSNIKHFMFILDFLGYIISCIVTVAIVLNYTIYCELAKFYVDAISKKIEMRCIKLNMIKNDIQNVSGTITLINGMIGRMMSLVFILKINMLIVGINNLLMSERNNKLELAFRFYFVLHLIPLVVTALIQCVRVNLAMKAFKKWGRHMSVFGYRKETKKQLDSFLLYTMGYNSKARLIALPLEWWQLMIFCIILGFILVTMIQTGVMDQTPLFKNILTYF